MSADGTSQKRFDPKRFLREEVTATGVRKEVRFDDNDPPRDQRHPTNRATPHVATLDAPPPPCSYKLLKLSVISIFLYLFFRDGWAMTLVSGLLTLLHSPRSTSSRVSRDIPPATLAKIDEAVFRARVPVALRDYALAADGGMIVDDLTFAFDPELFGSSPELVLSDDNHIGNCWLFSGSRGQIGISIPEFIHPTHVSIDHIPQEIAADVGQAPRRMILWGVVDGLENKKLYRRFMEGTSGSLNRNHPPATRDEYLFVELADFVYNITSPRDVQTFAIGSDFRNMGMDIGLFVLEIVDNWGADSTCVYRIRIHGDSSLGVAPPPAT